MNDRPIKKRGVFFIGGYDPKSPDTFFVRNRREAKRFEDLWDVTVVDGPNQAIGDDVTLVTYRSKPNNKVGFEVETDFHFLTLDDIVFEDFSKPLHTKLTRYLVTFCDYVFSGTAFSFFRHAWRFALYFCYPAGMAVALMILSLSIGNLLADSPLPFASFFAVVTSIVLFFVLITTAGKRYYILHLMALWSFSRDFIHQNRSDIEIKLDRFADLIASQAKANRYDELILVGHSTGGALILDAAGRAEERTSGFYKNCGQVSILTVGSTALKIGLHPKAKNFRGRIHQLFSGTPVKWVEYQCLTDIINFYKTNPAKLMGMDFAPIIGRIKVRHMVTAETYKRIKRNFFRVHYQFVYGNTKRYPYDFPAICFAAAPLTERAKQTAKFYDNPGYFKSEPSQND